ncbi:MAG: ABC transporter ATP-binding protein, partial [Thermodesulfovibrionales bacterium]|nr:ABC transporter ATP-binding protein [Thermodesulfovibrionales bacterium]
MSTAGFARLSRLKEQIYRYAEVSSWLIRDSAWRFKGLVILVLATEFIGLGVHVSSVGFALYYAKAIQAGGLIEKFGYSIDPRTSIELLFSVAVIVMLSLAVASTLIYISGIINLKLRWRYHKFCAIRVLERMDANLRYRGQEGQRIDSDMLMKLVRVDSKSVGKILFMFTGMIVPSLASAVALAALFYLLPLLTVVLAAMMSVFIVFLYKVNIKGANSTMNRERYAPISGKEIKDVFRRILYSSIPLPKQGAWMQQKLFNRGATKKFFDAYEGRLKAPLSSTLVNDILLAGTLFVIIMMIGSKIITSGSGWGELAIYVVALQYALVNIKKATLKITVINRFYPRMKRYFNFLSLNEPTGPVEPLEEVDIIVGPEPIGGSLDALSPRKGSVTCVISPEPPSRATLGLLFERMLWDRKELADRFLSSSWFNGGNLGYLPLSVRDSFGFPHGYSKEDFRKDLDAFGIKGPTPDSLVENFNQMLVGKVWRKFDQKQLVNISLFNALSSDRNFVLIDEHSLNALDPGPRELFFRRLSDKVVFLIFYSRIRKLDQYGDEDMAVVLGED